MRRVNWARETQDLEDCADAERHGYFDAGSWLFISRSYRRSELKIRWVPGEKLHLEIPS
jgi:hypothetical protein